MRTDDFRGETGRIAVSTIAHPGEGICAPTTFGRDGKNRRLYNCTLGVRSTFSRPFGVFLVSQIHKVFKYTATTQTING